MLSAIILVWTLFGSSSYPNCDLWVMFFEIEQTCTFLLNTYLSVIYTLVHFEQHTELLADLSLCEAKLCCQLGTLWQGQVLRRLELPLQHCQLVAGVDGPGFAHLLWLPIDHTDLHVWLLFHYRRKTVEKPILQYHGNCCRSIFFFWNLFCRVL